MYVFTNGLIVALYIYRQSVRNNCYLSDLFIGYKLIGPGLCALRFQINSINHEIEMFEIPYRIRSIEIDQPNSFDFDHNRSRSIQIKMGEPIRSQINPQFDIEKI